VQSERKNNGKIANGRSVNASNSKPFVVLRKLNNHFFSPLFDYGKQAHTYVCMKVGYCLDSTAAT
jgi:hypothetical protein